MSVHPTGCSDATNGYITADMSFDAGQRLRTGLQRMTGGPVEPGNDHVVERLAKLADLLERGLLSREEFDRLKAELLSA